VEARGQTDLSTMEILAVDSAGRVRDRFVRPRSLIEDTLWLERCLTSVRRV